MVTKALEQLVHQVDWGPTDVLVIDMPPGTGDAQISICQNVKLAGIVIATTPQQVAVSDADKAIDMFKRMNVPVRARHPTRILGSRSPARFLALCKT